MKLFTPLYKKIISLAKHRFAPYYLAGLSFAESSFFPVPPDVMLIPMGLAKPNRSWQLALLTTVFSVLGGILGYYVGVYFFELLMPFLIKLGYAEPLQIVKLWFSHWGIWIILLAGFSPIPYKLFTLGAGMMHMPFFPFIIASIIGRGSRFFLVAGCCYYFGEQANELLTRYIERISIIAIIILLVAIIRYFI